MSEGERVLISDTTPLDGEQSPGSGMVRPEKLRVAREMQGPITGLARSALVRQAAHGAGAPWTLFNPSRGRSLVCVEYNQRTYRGSSVCTILEVINRIGLAASNVARSRVAQAAM